VIRISGRCLGYIYCRVYSSVRWHILDSNFAVRLEGWLPSWSDNEAVYLLQCFCLRLQYYNVWLSLMAFIMCVGIMFLLSWIMSLATFVVVIALYLLVVYRKPGNVNPYPANVENMVSS